MTTVTPPGLVPSNHDHNASGGSAISVEEEVLSPGVLSPRDASPASGGSGGPLTPISLVLSDGPKYGDNNNNNAEQDDGTPTPPDKFRPSLRVVMAVATGSVVLLVAVATLLVSNLVTTAAVQDLGQSMSKSLANAAARDAETYFEKYVSIVDAVSKTLRAPESRLPQDAGTGADALALRDLICSAFSPLQQTVSWSMGTLGMLYEPLVPGSTTGCGVGGALAYPDNAAGPLVACGIRSPLAGSGPTTNFVKYHHYPSMTYAGVPPAYTDVFDQGTDSTCSKTFTIVRGVSLKNTTAFWSAALAYNDAFGGDVRATLNFPLLQAAYNSSNHYLGVIATSVSAEATSKLLKNLDRTSNSQIFAIDASAQVLGSTMSVQPFLRYNQDKSKTFPTGCLSTNDVVPETGSIATIICPFKASDSRLKYAPLNYVAANEDALLNSRTFALKQLDIDGTPFFVSSAPVKSSARLFSLNILFFLPEEDLLGDIVDGRNIAIGIAIAVLIVAVLLAVWIVFKILQPINVVLERMDDAAKLKMHGVEALEPSNVSEIFALQMSFAHLWAALASFGMYVPKDVVRDLLDSGEKCKLGMSKKYISMLATDIRGFSTIAERCDPDALSRTITVYFDEMTSIMGKCGAVLISFIGDATLATWNATSCTVFNHEIKAACAAMLIQHVCCTDPVRSSFDDIGEAIVTRVGVHCGEATVGNIGSNTRMSFDCIGSSVNLTFRMEGQNKAFGSKIMTSQDMVAKIQNVCCCRYLMPIAVVGFSNATHVFELVGLRPKIRASDVLEAKEESVSFSAMSVASRGTTDGGPTLSTRAGANVTAQRVLEYCLALKEQSLQASDAEDKFAAAYSRCAQLFADGDPKSCLEDLAELRRDFPAFFKEDASDVRDLVGEKRCDSMLMLATLSGNVLEKQCRMALAEDGHNSSTLRSQGRPASLIMRAESK